MASRAKNKLWLINATLQYHKYQQDRLAKQIIQEKRAQNDQNTFEKVRAIAEELNIKLETAVTEKKSEWTGRIKDEVGNKI